MIPLLTFARRRNVPKGSAALLTPTLVFTTQPANTAAGATMATVVVTAEINAVTDAAFTGAVTIKIGTNPSGGTLSGTLTQTAVAGVATFNDLSISAVGTGYTLVASATGITGGTSATFNITGSGVPTPSGTIITDTRSGGAQDWTGQTTLANALAVSGTGTSSNGYPFGWTTGFEHSTNGRALVANYKSGIGALSILWNRAGMTVTGIFAYQYKMWLGATAGGGGNGAVGDFDWGVGHKIAVIFFRDQSGGSSTNDNRHTHDWSTQQSADGGNPATHSFIVETDGTVFAAGTCSGAGAAGTLNDTGQAWTVNQWATGHYVVRIWSGTGSSGTSYAITANTATSVTATSLPATDATSKYRIMHVETMVSYEDNHSSTYPYGVTGRGVATDLNALNGTVVTITTKITPETSPGSADGLLEMWCNTTKVFTGPSTARTGAPPLCWKELQLVGPTWNAGPARDFSGYFWDLVIWNPAS